MSANLAAAFAQGSAALEAGDLATAERIFQDIVHAEPRAHDAWLALALIAMRTGSADLAVGHAKRAVELDRRNPLYLNNLGIAYGEQGDFEAAEQAFRRAVRAKPAYARAHYNLAKALLKQNRLAEARVEYERAHALEPGTLAMQLGLCRIYRLLGEPARGLRVLRASLGTSPPQQELIPAMAECIADVEGAEAAVAWLQQVILQQPSSASAHNILGHLLLSVGDWRNGWYHYLWRALPDLDMARRTDPLPVRLDGQRLLLRPEQGLGDMLMFLRFAAELRERGAAIAFEAPARLTPLVAGGIALREVGTAYDLEILLGDLPAMLQTESTPPAFQLRLPDADRARARETLARLGPPPYLAITWRAGTDVLRGREFAGDLGLIYKEIPPALLGKAMKGWPGTIVSLQRNPSPGELDAMRSAAGAPVHDLAAANENLSEVLSVLSQLNEYACVSNTNVHLLAGLGRTARVLIPHPPDWRWMRRDGPSDWFPGFPVYRQPLSMDWTEPLKRLREDLLARAGSPPRAPA